jgi:hypothetical protein
MDHNDQSVFQTLLLSTLENIKDEVKDVKRVQSSISETLVRNTSSLEEHIRRTDILEDRFGQFEEAQRQHMAADDQGHRDLAARLEILEEPRKVLKWVRNAIIAVGTLAGAIYAIMKLLGEV